MTCAICNKPSPSHWCPKCTALEQERTKRRIRKFEADEEAREAVGFQRREVDGG